ncbi:uncharacterized protein V2V93DRAFT_387936 [Kockiozyma suomiensis]|uniref:uncharacterized protein n=1 Tax=Kockiozyma suomiensis TaxID=1337062 RepID=UPI0033440E84
MDTKQPQIVARWVDLRQLWPETEHGNIQFSCALSYLPTHEQDSVRRFHFRRDASTHLASLLLQHATITSLAQQQWCESSITRSQSGRPSASKPVAFDYSVSHHGSRVVIAVRNDKDIALSRRIGADLVDLSSAGTSHIDDFREVFAPEECASIAPDPSTPAQPVLLFSYWALKEAYTKALGVGLVTDLHSIVFSNVPNLTLSDLPYSDAIRCHRNGKSLPWRFELFMLDGGLLLAIATPLEGLLHPGEPTAVSPISLQDILVSASTVF